MKIYFSFFSQNIFANLKIKQIEQIKKNYYYIIKYYYIIILKTHMTLQKQFVEI